MAYHLSQPRIEDPIWLEPNDISFLQIRISEAEALAQRIENQIEELRAQILELTSQKDAKLAEITTLRNVLAPVRRVPLEILSGIFELSCLPDEKNFVRSTFALSGVCAAWRKAAHAIPRLWCKLNISLQRHYLRPDFRWVTAWITRCQGLPLDLYLDLYVTIDQYGEIKDVTLKERGKAFLEYVLVNFSHKIRILEVFGHFFSFLPILQLPPSSPLLLLEQVSLTGIEIYGDTTEWNIGPPSKVFLSSPKLRVVNLGTVTLLDFMVLPAEQLTRLKLLINSEPSVHGDVLSRCSSLVSLEIDGYSYSFMNHFIVSLPALKSFRVANGNCFVTGVFLRCLIAPLLEDLFIGYGCEYHLDALVDDLTAFQQQSATKLSSLTLLHWTDDSEYIRERVVAILSLFPTIHSFEFRPECDVDFIFQVMTCAENYHVLPNLKCLVLHSRYEIDLDASELKSMVLSRWWPDRLENSGGLISDRKGLCRLQKVTIQGFSVRGAVEDITDLSALSGFTLYYMPKER